MIVSAGRQHELDSQGWFHEVHYHLFIEKW
jgi:hypothetical protein